LENSSVANLGGRPHLASPNFMIIHKLILQHLKHKDDADFYLLQARDAIRWIEKSGARLGEGVQALDLGCGHGVFGVELQKKGCEVGFADEDNYLYDELKESPFQKIDLDNEDLGKLGQHDLVVCSNVLEHLAKPFEFLTNAHKMLKPGGHLYLSWTNWLSPWGGHDFSPWHYLGPKLGHRIWDKFHKRKRIHTPFETLYPTYIGETLAHIRKDPNLRVRRAAPRYYNEFGFFLWLPIVREFITWNCALLIERLPEKSGKD
jgi:SAM-dependent methyltransferase